MTATERRKASAQSAPFLGNALLTVEEMYAADAAAAASGVSSEALMEAAGAGVAAAVQRSGPPRPVAVLCGPGNNGGDGFVAARLLEREGWPVRLALLGAKEKLTGDARINADRWNGEILPMGASAVDGAAVVVDALFGAGLTRPVEGAAAEAIRAIGNRHCIAVDVPSGVHGDSGAVLGLAPRAHTTVTFFRRKPGHLLLPGRLYCGNVEVVDIGIPDSVLPAIGPQTAANTPDLWMSGFPWPRLDQHKYDRGHTVISGGPVMTGAARLAARAALRIGSGMVSVAVPADNAVVYKIALVGVIVRAIRDTSGYKEIIEDPRVTCCLVGPGNGLSGSTREQALAALRGGKTTLLDADALTVFEETPELLFSTIKEPCVMTPHPGEFQRLFKIEGDRLSRTRAAASVSGAVVLLKGADTVIAAPDGRAVVNENAPAELATAGAGDVLSGIIAGLMGQGMAPFDAACTGAWIHGAAAAEIGPGLIAEDLTEALPVVLRRLREREG